MSKAAQSSLLFLEILNLGSRSHVGRMQILGLERGRTVQVRARAPAAFLGVETLRVGLSAAADSS